jgi:hypothetical protein
MDHHYKKINMEKFYKTSDIILAACLKLNDYDMVMIEKEGNKGTFVFADVDPAFVTEYDLGKVRVEPVEFNNAIKQLTTSVRRMQ